MALTNSDLADALDRTLTDLINLGLVAKQAHWNLVGARFNSLHVLLDRLADVARNGGDDIAERSMALGHHPDGRAETVTKNNPLPSLPLGPVSDDDAISAFANILEIVTTRLFDTISSSGCDPVTQDILVGVAADLDKLAWMIRSHATA